VEGEDDYCELKELSKIEITKAAVSKLPRKKLASVLAAYLVDYEDTTGAEFRKIQKCIYAFCTNTLTGGSVLVDAEEEDADAIMKEMIESISDNYGDGYSTAIRRSLKVRLSTFMQLIRNDSGHGP